MEYVDIEDRLKGIKYQGKPLFKQVLTALDQDAVLNNGVVRQDAAFVLPMEEIADPSFTHDYEAEQIIETRFGVMVSVRAVNDRLGRNINQRLQSIYKAVRRSLIGWEPQDGIDAITFTRGELVLFGNGGAFWLEEYQTKYTEKQEQQQ